MADDAIIDWEDHRAIKSSFASSQKTRKNWGGPQLRAKQAASRQLAVEVPGRLCSISHAYSRVRIHTHGLSWSPIVPRLQPHADAGMHAMASSGSGIVMAIAEQRRLCSCAAAACSSISSSPHRSTPAREDGRDIKSFAKKDGRAIGNKKWMVSSWRRQQSHRIIKGRLFKESIYSR